ncbi:MAG: heavy-metal-associated domain-containing protein [Gammaproteobacteria bacterium]|nr:heavy-metal-associated domain-containing protein [Gammaproteobacteria bacterium]MCW8839430.1 heavy-metal-associated domain-containing protein [Gammaproteobacteria bacterium]MCW8927471.1 heavy-metal-associated domain-containing protein [Gammaproteobacteria bacterium]MCW8959172.1 heavy-metal-associated domain-containing protein [Gammaproteobacteria bacterium]MCW8971894.1 heavy-metal-associated domain-containing protein [Gammaproteobacteria bacterium]
MSNEQFTVQNVKCGGCVSAIESGLKELTGVESVEVTIEGGQVTVSGESLSREAISDKLKQLGYPEV